MRLTRIFTLRLTEDDAAQVERIALEQGTTQSKVLRSWVQQGLIIDRVSRMPAPNLTQTINAQGQHVRIWYR